MLFPSCSRILLFPLLFTPHGPNKVVMDPSCTWIRCTRTLDTLMEYLLLLIHTSTYQKKKDTLMDLSILTWLKHSKPMHSMPLSMPLSWTESLDHLEHVMGPCWCFWAGPHHLLSIQNKRISVLSSIIGHILIKLSWTTQ